MMVETHEMPYFTIKCKSARTSGAAQRKIDAYLSLERVAGSRVSVNVPSSQVARNINGHNKDRLTQRRCDLSSRETPNEIKLLYLINNLIISSEYLWDLKKNINGILRKRYFSAGFHSH